MKKLFGFIAILGIITSLTYTGCRKGEEDPFLSLRSRDKRIIGTWVLKSYSDVITTTTTTTDYNNVNSERTAVETTETESLTFDGTIETSDVSTTTKTTQLQYDVVPSTANPGKYIYNAITSVVIDYSNVVNKHNYSIELEINDDHTYKATCTKSKLSYHTSGYQTVAGITTQYTPYDTTYSPADSYLWVDEGDWYWEDAKDQKIMIVSGDHMSGKLKKLSNKEVIIEDITEESSDDTNNTTIRDTYDFISGDNYGIPTYKDNTNPDRDTTGVEINHVVEKKSKTYTSTWSQK